MLDFLKHCATSLDASDWVGLLVMLMVIWSLYRAHINESMTQFNLFDLVIGLLEERKLLDKAIEMQRTQGDAKTLESLRRVLKEDKLAERLVAQHDIAELDLLILWNVGAVYPMLRTHTLLSALHAHMKDTPLVMFYPGKYDGYSLRLFSRLKDDHYYRAFRLVS